MQAENALRSAKVAAINSIVEAWTSIPDESFILQRCSEYVKATAITPPAPCGRSFLTDQLTVSFSFPFSDSLLLLGHPLYLLSANQSMVAMFTAPFSNHTTVLDGSMLHHDYVTIDSISQTISFNLCSECIATLNSKRLPCFSLRNNLFRGWLPDEFRDLSWVEEKVCTLHRVTADVARLHNAEQDEKFLFAWLVTYVIYRSVMDAPAPR